MGMASQLIKKFSRINLFLDGKNIWLLGSTWAETMSFLLTTVSVAAGSEGVAWRSNKELRVSIDWIYRPALAVKDWWGQSLSADHGNNCEEGE